MLSLSSFFPFLISRTLSALAHWSAIFSDTPYLPLLAFPFVKLFQNNQLICFEVVATLISKYFMTAEPNREWGLTCLPGVLAPLPHLENLELFIFE